jgi:hypothetical protein
MGYGRARPTGDETQRSTDAEIPAGRHEEILEPQTPEGGVSAPSIISISRSATTDCAAGRDEEETMLIRADRARSAAGPSRWRRNRTRPRIYRSSVPVG